MNLLFLLPYTPTPIRTRPYNLLRALLHRGNRITLATVWESEAEHDILSGWQTQGVRVVSAELSRGRKLANLLTALPSSQPLQARFCWQPNLIRLIKADWQGEGDPDRVFDIVHCEHLRGASFALDLSRWLAKTQSSRICRPKVVWDSVDCISLLFEKASRNSRSLFGRIVTAFDLPRTRRHEGWLVNQFDRTLVTAEADRVALEKLAQSDRLRRSKEREPQPEPVPITVLPNGVDLESFTPNYGPRSVETVVLTGKMSYHANVTAALYLVETVMPAVWASRPNASVQIVGANPPAEIRSLAVRYPGRVEVTGTVPDLTPYLQQATLAAAPIAYGVGIQNKVLEAMSCATPVVCTPQAVSALGTQAGQDLLVGESSEDLSAAILQLLGDLSLRQSMGIAGRRYVEQYHSWDTAAGQLEEIYQSIK